MPAEYQHIYNYDGVLRYVDNSTIPPDPANVDWQRYEAYVVDGGITDPAPEPPEVVPTPDANARIYAGAQAAVETYQNAPMPPPSVDPSAPVQGGLPEIEARLNRLETTLQAWVDGQMTAR